MDQADFIRFIEFVHDQSSKKKLKDYSRSQRKLLKLKFRNKTGIVVGLSPDRVVLDLKECDNTIIAP